jgi:hypothetical protein
MAIFNKMHPGRPFTRFAAALLLLLGSSSGARADVFLSPWVAPHLEHRQLGLLPDLRYSTSSANYQSDGRLTPITGLEHYSRVYGNVLGAYGLSNALTVYGRLSWAKVDVASPGANADHVGLTDQAVGAVWRVNEAPWSLDLAAEAEFPAYSNAAANGLPLLGDGSYNFTAAAYAQLPLAASSAKVVPWAIRASAGYMYRSAGFSGMIPWQAGLWHQAANWSLHAGARGGVSLRTDVSSRATSMTDAGGSYQINAVNPSFVNAGGGLGLDFSPRLGLWVNLEGSVWSQSAPQQLTMAVGARLLWDFDPRRSEYKHSNRGFIDYNFEGKVIGTEEPGKRYRIDKGSQDGVELGQTFDVFSVKKDGTIDKAVARATCTALKLHEALLTISETFKSVKIEDGFFVKHPLQ